MTETTGWIFKNCPFQMLGVCFKRLFPNIKYEAYLAPELKDDTGKEIYGLTTFADGGEIEISIGLQLSINDTVETFAHELAHAAVGAEHGHDDVWVKAFDDLFEEYNRLGEEMFSSNINAPKGEDYLEALEKDKEIERLRAENEEQDQAIIRALHGMGEIRRTARAEAITEFAERVKKAPDILDVNGYSMIGVDIVEIIAKELKGETEKGG